MVDLKRDIESKHAHKQTTEQRIRDTIRQFEALGVYVRRENLCRGHAFRVKSGLCSFGKQKLIFVDKRLPPSQQLSFLSDLIAAQKSA